jgi:hypothetical protein
VALQSDESVALYAQDDASSQKAQPPFRFDLMKAI